ncbi:MAG TPA: tetratricopeptide repeat protein, partial [Candidatus Saccharimonadales bacterium]|nr:tetratricopeptide repeat protein [Candidatus Saccharimonadales bacterium]
KSQSLTLQRGRLLSEWVGLSESPFSLPTYLTRTFPEMLGWPVYLLAVAGTVLLFLRLPRGWVVAAVPLLLLLPTGFMALARERFMAPAIGSLVVAAAAAVVWLASRIPARASAVTMISLLALGAAWPIPAYVRLRETLHRPDTRVAAHRWIERAIPATEPMAIDVYGPEFKPDLESRLSLIWPFLATQTPLVRAAYRPEWLDGLRYYVSSSEVVGRFETAAARYPDEDRFHRWIRSHGAVVWTSDSTAASGPRIEVRTLPAGISSREERDAAWAQARGAAMYAPRLARWCAEMASIFLRKDQYDRAEEWASRGLSIRESASRRKLLETLALAQVRLDRASEAEETARAGLQDFPESPLLHVDRAMALEGLGRNPEAIAEFNRALALGSTEASAGIIRAEIARLERAGR